MERRFALLVSSSEYQDKTLSQLITPQADVEALASVLRDPLIGDFENVTVLSNEPSYKVREAIAAFFNAKKRDDFLLLYFTGHGILDVNGRLYLATSDTKRDVLRANVLPATYITDEMDNSLSRRQVLILDCCHSGAFTRGSKGIVTGTTVGIGTVFKGMGYGRIVLTASDATQYAWEGEKVTGEKTRSVFTHFIIEGLRTGEADLLQDGQITIDELYDYVYEHILQLDSDKRQTPGKWSFKQEGELVIAHNPHPQPQKVNTLPTDIEVAIHSPLPSVRLAIIETLGQLLDSIDGNLAHAAFEALTALAKDDSRKVAITATTLLENREPKKSGGDSFTSQKQPLLQQTNVLEKSVSSEIFNQEHQDNKSKERKILSVKKYKKYENILMGAVIIFSIVASVVTTILWNNYQDDRGVLLFPWWGLSLLLLVFMSYPIMKIKEFSLDDEHIQSDNVFITPGAKDYCFILLVISLGIFSLIKFQMGVSTINLWHLQVLSAFFVGYQYGKKIGILAGVAIFLPNLTFGLLNTLSGVTTNIISTTGETVSYHEMITGNILFGIKAFPITDSMNIQTFSIIHYILYGIIGFVSAWLREKLHGLEVMSVRFVNTKGKKASSSVYLLLFFAFLGWFSLPVGAISINIYRLILLSLFGIAFYYGIV